MSEQPEQLKKKIEQVRLSADERARLRERLEEYMSYKPLRVDEAPSTKRATPTGRSFIGDVVHLMQTRYLPAALVAVLAFGGTVSFAAESSVPGEALYPLKVNFNEEIISALSFTQEAKAEWDARRAERRLEEAGQLAARGTLDEETSAEVAERFAVHAEEATKRTEEIQKSDPGAAAEMSTEFSNVLEAQEAILARLSVEGEEHDEVRALIQNIRIKSKDLARVLAAAESVLSAREAQAATSAVPVATDTVEVDETTPQQKSVAERMQQAAENRLAEAGELLVRAEGDIESSVYARAEAQLARAREHVAAGADQFARASYGEAYAHFKEAVSISQKLTRFLRAVLAYHIDILPLELLPEDIDATSTPAVPDTGFIDRSQQSAREIAQQVEEALMMQQEARDAIEQARGVFDAALKADQDIDAEALETLKDAEAFLVRGEVAFESDDFNDAYRFFRRVMILAQDAQEQLAQFAPDSAISPAPSENPRGVPAVGTTTDRATDEELTVTHAYADGTHVFEGAVRTPTVCYRVDVATTVAESFPEQIGLEITTTQWSPLCLMQEAEKPFRVELQASASAKLTRVLLNGKPQKFEVIQRGDVPPLPTKPVPTSTDATSTEHTETTDANGATTTRARASTSAAVSDRAALDSSAASGSVETSTQSAATIDVSL